MVLLITSKCVPIGKFSATANEITSVVRNQFSALEHTSKIQKTRKQFCTQVWLDTWKFTNAWNVINRHWRPMYRKCRIWDYKNKFRLSYCTYTVMKSLLGCMRASRLT